MKKIYGMMAAVLAGVLAGGLTSCQQEVDPVLPDADQPLEVCALVEGSMATRASGAYWDKGDAIGINAWDGTKGVGIQMKFVSDITDASATSSNFKPELGYNIRFKTNNTLSFEAYYPWGSDRNSNVKDFDSSTDCTSKNVDFMWASGATAKHNQNFESGYYYGDSTNPKIYFDGSGEEGHGSKFKHVMSRVIIRVHVGDGIEDTDVTGGSCQLRDLYTQGRFYRSMQTTTGSSSQNGTVQIKSGTSRTALQLVEDGVGKSGVSFDAKVDDFYRLTTMFLIPQTLGSNGLSFGLKLNGEEEYKYCNAKIGSLEAGKSYELDVTVSKGYPIYVSDCEITDWETVKYVGSLNGDASESKGDIGNSENDYSPTGIGDLMFADGTTLNASNYARKSADDKTAYNKAHGGGPIGIVGCLYRDTETTLKDGVSGALTAKGVTPHGLVLSLQESGQITWDNVNKRTKIGTGYDSAASCYPDSPDGISFQNLPVGTSGTVLDCAKAGNGFEAFKWCNDLNSSVTSDWVKNSTTGWYMPSYSEWVDMFVSFAYASVPEYASGFATSLRQSVSFGYGTVNLTNCEDMYQYINDTLTAGGGTPLGCDGINNCSYWIATQKGNDLMSAVYLVFYPTYISIQNYTKTTKNSVRGVLAF